MKDMNKLLAECFGTFWLVFGGCGSAVLAAGYPTLGIGFAGVALAFGLTVVTMAYAVGHVSGGHFNPAVTLGLWAGGRFESKNVLPYWLAQVVGGVLAAMALYLVATNKAGGYSGGLATNGYGALSPDHYGMVAGAIIEVLLTAFFLIVIMGATDGRAPAGFAPLAIGLCLTLIHLISIPVTNTSVNPARSFGPAFVEWLVGNGDAMGQLWFFWVMPLIGGVLGGMVYRHVIAPAE